MKNTCKYPEAISYFGFQHDPSKPEQKYFIMRDIEMKTRGIIIATKTFMLTTKRIKGMYEKTNDDEALLLLRSYQKLGGRFTFCKIYAPPNGIEKVYLACGKDPNPEKCDVDTIRFIYGNHNPNHPEQGIEVVYNTVHRVKTVQERDRTELFFNNLKVNPEKEF